MTLNPINWDNLDPAIIASIEEAKAANGWHNVGIRIQDGIQFEAGPLDHVSHVWIDGDDTGEELPGVCAISADDIGVLCRNAKFYAGDHVAIVVGDVSGMGEDPAEVIFTNAEVWQVLA